MKPRFLLMTLPLLASLLVGPAMAENFALLIGVSNYPTLTKLPGATNDVKLMGEVLVRKGFKRSNIQTLADGISGKPSPTRANILQALDQLVSKAGEGDYVYLHFSGHGSQQYADAKSTEHEADGLTEIFLPIDVGRSKGGRKPVPNAIADFELIRYLNTLLAKGAFVWGVFDACHSATLMRDGDDFTNRHVSPKDLGLDLDDRNLPSPRLTNTRGSGAGDSRLTGFKGIAGGKGKFVAFYGAQTDQKAPEGLMPRNTSAEQSARTRHGVLTYTLAEALEGFSGGSFRQLSHYIQQRYIAQGIFQTIPAFSGDALDVNIFTPHQDSTLRQWPLDREARGLSIPAGTLHDVSPGSQFVLLPNALADESQALARAEAVTVDALSAELRLIANKGATVSGVTNFPIGTVARLTRPSTNLALRVAIAKPTEGTDTKLFEETVKRIRTGGLLNLRVQWVDPKHTHDILLRPSGDRIFLQRPGFSLGTRGDAITSSVELGQSVAKTSQELANTLELAAKAIAISRLADSLEKSATNAKGLTLHVTHKRGGNGPPTPLTPRNEVLKGDDICILAGNSGRSPLDLTLLLLDSDFGVQTLFPQAGINRLQPGDQLKEICIEVFDDLGLDRLVAFAVPARPEIPATDLSFLAQPSLPVKRGQGGESDLEALLGEAAFGTRSSPSPRPGTLSKVVVKTFTWRGRESRK
jgi:hypothetical protein